LAFGQVGDKNYVKDCCSIWETMYIHVYLFILYGLKVQEILLKFY